MNATVRHFWELLWGLTEKELRARYKYTLFGFIWIVANPLLQMLIIGFVFTFVMKEPIKNYYYHLFIGLLIWNFYSLSLTKATTSIVYERALIKKAAFPRAIIPIAIILSNAIHLVAALALLFIPVHFIQTFSIMSFVFIIIATMLLFTFTTGISLLACALNVQYRDVNFFVQALLLVWFYATPIIYSLMQMPSNLLWVWRFNPLTSILQLYQHAILNEPLPGLAMLASNIFVILVITCGGVLYFQHKSKTFDDWV